MGPGFSEGIARGLVLLIAMLVAGAAIIGGLLVWGIPRLWEWLKPLIHGWTT